jgi:UDP-2,3-diacylglucosamine pyrophosphatase LpxH
MTVLLERPCSNGGAPFFAPMPELLQAPVPVPAPKRTPKRTTDTLVISDLHLGSHVCRADALLDVLKSWKFRRLVILGDAFDSTKFKRLKRSHFKVLSHINKLSGHRRNVEVVWVEGNHDATFLKVVSAMLGMSVHHEYTFHVGGRKYLATHGHQFDTFMNNNPVITEIASAFYLLVQRRDTRRMSVSRYLKKKSKLWLRLSDKQAIRAVRHARRVDADCVLCGHTHISSHRRNFGGVEYINTGCWTDTPCQYVTIDENGATLHEHQ